jgi:hypothetical protein
MEYWPSLPNVDMLKMARVITKYVHFLDPAIVGAVAQDNRLHTAEWSALLAKRGVDPRLYLWEDSPCCFPGIRRSFGAAEKAYCGKGPLFQDALELDYNERPKEIWAYVMDEIPSGYTLMHLLGHGELNHQVRVELELNEYLRGKGIYGLFTSPGSTVYVPNAFLTAINTSPRLRGLLIAKQQELYGGVCAIVPRFVRILPPSEGGGWKFSSFEWAPCSGSGGIQDFLQYRNAAMDTMFRTAPAAGSQYHN